MIKLDLSSFNLATAVSLSFRIGKGHSPSEVELIRKSALKHGEVIVLNKLGVRTRSPKSPVTRWSEKVIYTLEDRMKEVRLLFSKGREIWR